MVTDWTCTLGQAATLCSCCSHTAQPEQHKHNESWTRHCCFTSLRPNTFTVHVDVRVSSVCPIFLPCCISGPCWKTDSRLCGEKNEWFCGELNDLPSSLKSCCKGELWVLIQLCPSPILTHSPQLDFTRATGAECSRWISKCLQNVWA